MKKKFYFKLALTLLLFVFTGTFLNGCFFREQSLEKIEARGYQDGLKKGKEDAEARYKKLLQDEKKAFEKNSRMQRQIMKGR